MPSHLGSIFSLKTKGDRRSSDAASSTPQSSMPVSSSDTPTPRQFTSDTTMHWGSKAGSTFRDKNTETSRNEPPHCRTCTCATISKDPDIMKDSSGRPYNPRQLNHLATVALARYRNSQDADEKSDSMRVIRRALEQSDLSYKDAILKEASGFTPAHCDLRDYWIRQIMDEKTGFPATLEEAFKASCIPNSEVPREHMEGIYNRLQMARLRYSNDESD